MRKLSMYGTGALMLASLLFTTAFKPLPKITAKKFATSSANGGGTAIEGGVKSTFSFNAVRREDGSTNGHLMYNYRSANITIHVDIDCLNISAPGTATMGGVVTGVAGYTGPAIYVGQRIAFTVLDNGNGGSNDRVSDVYLDVIDACGSSYSTYLPIQGNVTVRN